MTLSDLLGILRDFGPPGLIIIYLLWERYNRDKREETRDQRQEQIRTAQAEADLELARALTLLTERINHVRGL